MSRRLKYFIIALINLLLLTVLLYKWVDRYELLFNEGVKVNEFLKILGCSIVSLIVMRMASSFFQNREREMKLSIAAVLTLVISSFLYVNYVSKVIDHRIKNGSRRDLIAGKFTRQNSNKSIAKDLTIDEYNAVSKIRRLPKLPNQATHISYLLKAEDFLPDYLFELSYSLPANAPVDTFHLEQGKFSKSQIFKVTGNNVNVYYMELLQ